MNIEQQVNKLIDNDKIDEALEYLTGEIEKHPDDASLWFLRGKIKWRLGEQASAITDYSHAANLDPEGPAHTALEHSKAIFDYFNPDLINP